MRDGKVQTNKSGGTKTHSRLHHFKLNIPITPLSNDLSPCEKSKAD